MPRQVTLAEVAKLAGVHVATVSRALNPATRSIVNEKTARRVESAAKSLGYVPNITARSLRTQTTMTVGVVIPDLTNPIFPPMIRGIENYLAPRGYTALLSDSDGKDALERSAIQSLSERRVDGFIIATGLERHPLLPQLYESGVPVVLANRAAGEVPYPLVTGNDEAGIQAAVHHLYDLGHRSVVHLAGPQSFSTSQIRARTMARVCDSLGMVCRVVEATALTSDQGEAVTDSLLSEKQSFTAIQASTDLLALGVLRSLRRHGLSCPDDMSVIGFNDMPFAEEFSPGLTTVRVPLGDIGSESARQLLRILSEQDSSPFVVTLPVSLVVRASTGPVSSH